MIEKIQGLIEDNTSLEITASQVKLLLSLVGMLFFLIIFMMMRASGPSENKKGHTPAPPNPNAPIHVSGSGSK